MMEVAVLEDNINIFNDFDMIGLYSKFVKIANKKVIQKIEFKTS